MNLQYTLSRESKVYYFARKKAFCITWFLVTITLHKNITLDTVPLAILTHHLKKKLRCWYFTFRLRFREVTVRVFRWLRLSLFLRNTTCKHLKQYNAIYPFTKTLFVDVFCLNNFLQTYFLQIYDLLPVLVLFSAWLEYSFGLRIYNNIIDLYHRHFKNKDISSSYWLHV